MTLILDVYKSQNVSQTGIEIEKMIIPKTRDAVPSPLFLCQHMTILYGLLSTLDSAPQDNKELVQ